MRCVVPTFLFLWSAQSAVSGTAAVQHVDRGLCTTTKVIPLDEPDLDWRRTEQSDREKYVSYRGHVLQSAEFEKLYEQPASADALLQNLKVIVDADLLAQPTFFDDANIKRVFGVESVSWTHDKLLGGATMVVAEFTIKSTILPGARGNARLMQERESGHRVYYVGAMDLELADNSIPVRAISRVFGPPQDAFPDCVVGMSNHVIQMGNCKGLVSYNYSRELFDSAYLSVNKLDLTIRKELPERKPLEWNPLNNQGRLRFLCDEDHVEKFTIMQQSLSGESSDR